MMPDEELRMAFVKHQQRKAEAGHALAEAKKARAAATKAVDMIARELHRRGSSK